MYVCIFITHSGSGGYVNYTGLEAGIYILRVVATNRRPDTEFIKRRFEITNDPKRCTVHLINSGVTVTGNNATVEFTGRGPVEGYYCLVDGDEYYECEYTALGVSESL